MPRGDKTGPRGEGPGTGRGLGGCVPNASPARTTRKGLGPCGDGTPRGGGMGRGRGGMGRRRGPNGVTFFT